MDRALSYLLRRLLILVIGIFVILTAEFVILRVLPGDPAMLATPRNPSFPAEDLEEIQAIFAEPLYVQYVEFIGDMLTGEFYMSFWYEQDVSEIIYAPMGRTLNLFLSTLVACLAAGALFAYLTSRLKGHVSRQVLSFLPLTMMAIPMVGWAWVLASVFAVQLDLLPIGHYAPPGMDLDDPAWTAEYLRHMILPVASLVMGSVGMFALAMRDGQSRAAAFSSPERPRLRDGLFVAMPSIQFLVAMAMCFVIVVDVFFSYRGLGWMLIEGFDRIDYFVIQASVFLISIMVFLTNFAIETVVTLVRPQRRLDLYMREDIGPPGQAAVAPAQPAPNGTVLGALKAVAKDYLKSPIGIVSLLVFLGMVALAVVGPTLSSDEIIYPWIHSSTDLFLDGATSMVAVPVLAALIASVVGMVLGLIMGLIRPYADGLVAGVMQGIIAIPLVCLTLILALSRLTSLGSDPMGCVKASLGFAVPIIAIVTLAVCHGFVSARRRVAVSGSGTVLGAPPVRYGPAIASWTLGALKYGVPMTAVAVFICDFLSITHLDSWGFSLGFAYIRNMLMTGEMDYVLMPIIGTFLLVGSMFLVLDTLERVVRTRFAHMI